MGRTIWATFVGILVQLGTYVILSIFLAVVAYFSGFKFQNADMSSLEKLGGIVTVSGFVTLFLSYYASGHVAKDLDPSGLAGRSLMVISAILQVVSLLVAFVYLKVPFQFESQELAYSVVALGLPYVGLSFGSWRSRPVSGSRRPVRRRA